jgi:two-component system, OmpR family, sensor histidine kinase KdpD
MKQEDDRRPDPDQLLTSLVSDEEKAKKGKLKIFFGMCAGVGKTYTMLQTAHLEKTKGGDIVIGYVETHNRKDTEELVAGFETIPRMKYSYKSALLEEMDIDAIINRKPGIVLIDELAHTNAPGSRHLKRYMDVREILENGINVYTTLNVQHLISRTDTVSQITGIRVMETVPDEIFETADEVELIDLTPEELLQRLAEGKVYTPERSREAVENFFKKGNITALREMALRIVADRVDKQLHDYLQNNRIRGPWKSGIHLLVAIDYRQQSTRLLRWAKNLAYSMGGKIQSLYVETTHILTSEEREQLDRNLKIAKQLGIPVRITTNPDIVRAIIDYAQKENISHIIVGKPRVRNIISMLKFGSYVDKLIRYSGNIDVYVLGSDVHAKDSYKGKLSMPAFTPNLGQYLIATFVVIITSLAAYAVKEFIGYQSVSFILLFVVSIMAMIFGTGPIVLSAMMSALIWDYFFIPPELTFHIDRLEDILMLFMYFFIAIISGALTSRIRRQEKKTRIREERTNALYQLTKDLSRITGMAEVTRVASNYINRYFSLTCVVLIKDEYNKLEMMPATDSQTTLGENERSVASWVFKNSSKAGRFTDTLPSGEFTYYPLTGESGNMGVLAVRHLKPFTHGEEQFWEAFLTQISSKYEREFLREAAKRTYLLNESDKLYRNLFNSISHELRTPVSAIVGASDTLIEGEYPEETRIKLYHEISSASLRLNRLINNLLNMSRLESGRITIKPDWYDIHDMANSLTESLKNELEPFAFSVVIPPGMPLVFIDSGLIEQAVNNLILNSTQYALPGSQIRVKFFYDDSSLIIQVMDRGPGIQPPDLNSVFEKFYRGKDARSGGTGLGLSIVKGFVEAHKGSITAANRKNGGAIFTVKIPVDISGPEKINTSTA